MKQPLTLSPQDHKQTMTLSPEGLKKAEQIRNATLKNQPTLFDVQERMKAVTQQAYDLILAIAKERAEPPSLSNFYGRTTAQKSLKELNALLDANPCWVDLNARHRYEGVGSKYNILHLAAEQGQLDIVKKLLEMGTPLDATTQKGTALCLATMQDHLPVVEYLLAQGASASRVLASTMERAHFGIYDDDTYPIVEAASRTPEMILTLCQHGADVNVISGPFGDTPIGETHSMNKVENLKTLIACGAKPDLSDAKWGHRTVLNQAIDHSTPIYISTLLDAGANIFLPNKTDSAYFKYYRMSLPHADEQKTAKALLIKKRHDEATSRWEYFGQHFDPHNVLPSDLVWCANIGKLDELMDKPGWPQAREHLQHLLIDTVPWIGDHIQTLRPDLMQPSSESTRWTDRIGSPNTQRAR